MLRIPVSKVGDMARAVLSIVPFDLTEAEDCLHWTSHGVDWQGRCDIVGLLDADCVLVGDYKTTSNPQRIMSPEQLEKDIQFILYVYGGMVLSGAKDVLGIWYYIQTNLRVTQVPVYLEDCFQFFHDWIEKHLAPAARELLTHWRRGPKSLPMLKANTAACGGFGFRCDVAQHCKEIG